MNGRGVWPDQWHAVEHYQPADFIKVIEKSGEQMVVRRYSLTERNDIYLYMYRCLKLVSPYVSIHLHERTCK